MEVRKGYKQTDLGIYPDEWKELKIKDISEISVGKDLVESEFSEYQDDTYKYPVFSNTVSNEGLYGFYNYSEYTKESLTVVGRGVGLGTAFKREVSFGAIGRLLVLKPFQEYDFRYLTYFINFRVNIHFESGGIPQLTGVSFGNYKVILPPTKSEQTAIATALSDADALISSLEKLIEKKRSIKQGAMQELLKPKEGWEVKKLGDVAILKARIGWQGLTTAEYKSSGDYILITGTEFSKGFIDWEKCVYVEENRYQQDKNIQVKTNDVLVTKDGTIGKVAIIKNLPFPATLNSGVFVIRPISNSFSAGFFYYLLLSDVFKKFLSRLTAGSTINHLYQKDFVIFEFFAPKKIQEQTRIATILSDIDAEITALEQKLAKYKQIKQGMMLELLTGRIRLVEIV